MSAKQDILAKIKKRQSEKASGKTTTAQDDFNTNLKASKTVATPVAKPVAKKTTNKVAKPAKKVASSGSHQMIKLIQIGEKFSSVYYVENAFVKKTVTGNDYTEIITRDASGSENVKYWGTVKGLEKGTWVELTGGAEDYQGAKSLIARNVSLVDIPADLTNFIAISESKDSDTTFFDDIREVISGTGTDTTCSAIIDRVFEDADVFSNFFEVPSSELPSYGKNGGLLSCSMTVARQASCISDNYDLSDIERQVLYTSSILHQIGCVEAYEFEDCVPVLTRKGKFMGTCNLSVNLISNAINTLRSTDNFSNEIADRVLHAISVVGGESALTKEAILLKHVVNMNNELVGAIDFISMDENNGEFTAFDTVGQKQYYKG